MTVFPGRIPGGLTRREAVRVFAGGSLAMALGASRPGMAEGARRHRRIKAIYLNPAVVDMDTGLRSMVDLIERTELNALVVDIKEEGVYIRTQVDLFDEARTVRPRYDVSDLIGLLKERGIYAIARQVIFKDTALVAARPDLAVHDRRTGRPWRDFNGVGWANPFSQEVQEANAALAREAIRLGFDEVQYDYVRFPTDGDLRTADYGQEATQEARAQAIVDCLRLGRRRLKGTGGKLTADVFGYTLLVNDDLGIGQNFERVARACDAICPMVYPSHWPHGSMGLNGHPNDFPYETIARSMDHGKAKVASAAKLRPWLQDFSLPGLRAYGAREVRAQIDAAEDAGIGGWMLWNALGHYHEAALKPAE